MEDQDIARVRYATLELLTEANGIGCLGDSCCVDLCTIE